MKLVRLAVVVALACGLGWYFLPAAVKQGVAARLKPTALSMPVVPSVAGAPGLRKCMLDGQTTYTNGDCPAGSREQAVTGGSLNVLPAAPVPASPDLQGAAPVGNVRDLLLKPDKQAEADLKAKRIDAIANQ